MHRQHLLVARRLRSGEVIGAGEGLVLMGGSEGDVVALSSADGVERWRTKVSSEVLAPPQVDRGVVVVRSEDGRLFGLDNRQALATGIGTLVFFMGVKNLR